MTDSTSGFHHSRSSRAVAESRAGASAVYRQAIIIRSCRHARVLYQAHAQLRSTVSSISSFGTVYEVLTLGGVHLQWSLRHLLITVSERLGSQAPVFKPSHAHIIMYKPFGITRKTERKTVRDTCTLCCCN
jgi:hypothetical protein